MMMYGTSFHRDMDGPVLMPQYALACMRHPSSLAPFNTIGIIAYFALIGHGGHKKTTPPTILRCHGNVFTEPLPSNVGGYTD
jgi:hypothetical protein